jgi:hypothetical protein
MTIQTGRKIKSQGNSCVRYSLPAKHRKASDDALLRILAGMVLPTWLDVSHLSEAAIREISDGKTLSGEEAVFIVCRDIAGQILEGAIPPLTGTERINRYVELADYPAWSAPFYGLKEEFLWGMCTEGVEAIKQDILVQARKLCEMPSV